MMADLGFKAEDDYLANLMDHFASFDADGDGLLGYPEFVNLWTHLGQPIPPDPAFSDTTTGAFPYNP